MTSMLRLQELADIISHHVATINLREQCSFPESTATDDSPEQSVGTLALQDEIMAAADELQMLLRRPEEYIMDLVVNQVRCFPLLLLVS